MLIYVAPQGESGSLDQCARECEAMLKTLRDPEAVARLMRDMPECVAAVDVWRPFVRVHADGTGGQIGLIAAETEEVPRG